MLVTNSNDVVIVFVTLLLLSRQAYIETQPKGAFTQTRVRVRVPVYGFQ